MAIYEHEYDEYYDENGDLDILVTPESEDEYIDRLIDQNRRVFYREWNGYVNEDRLKIFF